MTKKTKPPAEQKKKDDPNPDHREDFFKLLGKAVQDQPKDDKK